MMTIHHSTNNGASTTCGSACSGIQATRLWITVTCASCLRVGCQLQKPAPSLGIQSQRAGRITGVPGQDVGRGLRNPYMVSDYTPEQQAAIAQVDMSDFREQMRHARLRDFAARNPSGKGYVETPTHVAIVDVGDPDCEIACEPYVSDGPLVIEAPLAVQVDANNMTVDDHVRYAALHQQQPLPPQRQHRGISRGGECTDNDCGCHDPAQARYYV